VDSALVKALARAFRWRRMLDEGFCATLDELAKRECVNRGYLSRVLRLTLLAPDVVEAILDGRQAEGLRLEELLDGFPVEWESQSSGKRRGYPTPAFLGPTPAHYVPKSRAPLRQPRSQRAAQPEGLSIERQNGIQNLHPRLRQPRRSISDLASKHSRAGSSGLRQGCFTILPTPQRP
jgi:hypothetical protein